MTATHIAEALNGRRSGSRWIAHCPVHKDRTPSLSICESDGRILVYCFGGCAQRDVVMALRKRGLWPERTRQIWTLSERREYAQRRSQAEILARHALDWRSALLGRLHEAKCVRFREYCASPNRDTERGWAEASQMLFRHESHRGPALAQNI